jgi:hypothetical protein
LLTVANRIGVGSDLDDVDGDDLTCSELLPQLTDQDGPPLAQSVELDIEVTDKATRGAVAGKVRVLSAAQVELELDAGDGYKPRDLWLAQAAVSGSLFC